MNMSLPADSVPVDFEMSNALNSAPNRMMTNPINKQKIVSGIQSLTMMFKKQEEKNQEIM